MKVSEWLNPQNILSFALALLTLAYTISSFLVWSESRKQRKQKSQPIIIPYLRSSSDHSALMLHVKNIGEGCARSVRAVLIHDVPLFRTSKMLGSKELFKGGITMFPPQFELKYPIYWWVDFESEEDKDGLYVELYLEYEDLDGNNYRSDILKLDYKSVTTTYLNPPATTMERIPYYLHEISKEIKNGVEKVAKSK